MQWLILLQFHLKPEGGAHPRLAVDVGLLLQEELHHLDVAIVTRYMQRGVSHLTAREKHSETSETQNHFTTRVS